MPLPLVIAISASCITLTLSVIYHLLNPVFGLEYVIVLINLSAIVILLLLRRRSPTVIEWAQSIALIWGAIGAYFALTNEALSPPHFFLDILPFIESGALLVLYVVMKLPSSKRYLNTGSSPNTSLERTRER